MDYNTLRNHLLIVKTRLDEELEVQPQYLWIAGEGYAQAVSIRDALKEDIARVDSQIADELRSSEDKISEQRILSQIPLDKRHQIAVSKYNKSKLDCDKWYSLQESFRNRGVMLKSLVDLYIAGYYSKNSQTASETASKMLDYSENRAALAEARTKRQIPRRR